MNVGFYIDLRDSKVFHDIFVNDKNNYVRATGVSILRNDEQFVYCTVEEDTLLFLKLKLNLKQVNIY
jgi:hypothetical protein